MFTKICEFKITLTVQFFTDSELHAVISFSNGPNFIGILISEVNENAL